MNSIISKIIHSRPIKDSIAISRGVYKVFEGKYQVNSSKCSKQISWHYVRNQKQEGQINQKVQIQTGDQAAEKNNEEPKIEDQQLKNSIHQQKQQLRIKHFYTNQDLVKAGQQFVRQQKLSSREFYQSPVPASRIRRFYEFGKLGKNMVQSMVGSYFIEKTTGEKDSKGMEQRATILSQSLCKMRGAPLKLAQMLSIQQNSLIPGPVRKAFERARQTSHIVSLQEVEHMMTSNLGKDWRSKFTKFDNKPFASASIGQVHRAEVQDNKRVAVKIQYPGVAQSVNSDLDNLAFLVKYTGLFPKGVFIDKIITSARQELMQECNYENEKRYHYLYEKCLKKVYGEKAVQYRVPKCIEGYCSKQILTSQYLSGISMSELEQENYSQELRDEIGRRIMDLTFTEFFQMGIMQTDPNPSNFTYNLKKEQLNLLDFGATHIYEKWWLQQYYRLVQAAVRIDQQTIWDASIKTGFVTGQQNSLMRNAHIQSILLVGEALRFKGRYDFGEQAITKRIYQTIPIMLKNRLKQPPKQVYSLHRKLSGAYLACIRLKAQVDCSKIWEKIKFRSVIQQQLK